jgi:hypothetical protein
MLKLSNVLTAKYVIHLICISTFTDFGMRETRLTAKIGRTL